MHAPAFTCSRPARTAGQLRTPPPPAAPTRPPPQVASEFRFDIDTVAVAMNFFDRVCSKAVVEGPLVQSVALACIFLSSKLLEMRPLEMRHVTKYFLAICSPDTLRKHEKQVLGYLNWDANCFSAVSFMRHVLLLVPLPEVSAMGPRHAPPRPAPPCA